MPDDLTSEAPTLRDYLGAIWARKWFVFFIAWGLPLTAILLTLRQQDVFASSAHVLLSRQDIAASLGDTRDTGNTDPERQAKTQADLARGPDVARLALRRVRLPGRTERTLLRNSSVTAKSGEDILVFEVRDEVAADARRLASAYAHAYTTYRRRLDTLALRRARQEVESRIQTLQAAGETDSQLYADLVSKDQQLRTLEALQTSNANVVREAEVAYQVEPKPVKNGLLGLVLGILVGVGGAILWSRLDTRLRSSDEVQARLGLPLLARLPEPPRKLRSGAQLVTLAEPDSVDAEAFRILATNLEFTNLDYGARSIMVTSALEREGKSTSVANLAVSVAQTGRHVVLVDMDLRRASLARFFGLEGEAGLTHVALGRLSLEDA